MLRLRQVFCRNSVNSVGCALKSAFRFLILWLGLTHLPESFDGFVAAWPISSAGSRPWVADSRKHAQARGVRCVLEKQRALERDIVRIVTLAGSVVSFFQGSR